MINQQLLGSVQAANHKTQSLQQPAKAAADQHHAHTQHSHTTQVISNILKACVELMAGSDCAMQAKAHMGAQIFGWKKQT